MKCDFSFSNYNPNITKDIIYSAYPQETYMEYYVGRRVDKRRFCSPFRVDKHPSCTFYTNSNGILMFKDFSDGFCGDVISVVMLKFRCSYTQALQIIANDFHITSDTKQVIPITSNSLPLTQPTRSKIEVTIRNFTKSDKAYWDQFGISTTTLDKYRVYSCKAVFLNGSVHTISQNRLVFGYYGGTDANGDLWRIYYPNRRDFRFLTNWPKEKIQGWDQLPPNGKIVVVTKSMKDVMVFAEFGIPACAPNSEHFFLTDDQLQSIRNRFKKIVVLWDNDRPGKLALAKIRKKYPDLHCHIIPNSLGAKDISDLVKLKGVDEVKKLLSKFLRYLQNEEKT